MWLAQSFIENDVKKIKKRDDFTGHEFQNIKPVPSRPANKPDGTGRPAILSRPVLNPDFRGPELGARPFLNVTKVEISQEEHRKSFVSA